jgi:hypothetical protein
VQSPAFDLGALTLFVFGNLRHRRFER